MFQVLISWISSSHNTDAPPEWVLSSDLLQQQIRRFVALQLPGHQTGRAGRFPDASNFSNELKSWKRKVSFWVVLFVAHALV